MIVAYNYTKYKDVHTLKSYETTNDITYIINKVTCDATTPLGTYTLRAGDSVNLGFHLEGEFQIVMNALDKEVTSFNILQHNTLLLSFIDIVKSTVCGCGTCPECRECNDCEDYLGAYMKGFAFNAFNAPIYFPYIDAITQNSICSFTDEIVTMLLEEKVYGQPNSKEAMLRIVSYYYLAFYYLDEHNAIDAEEKAYVTTKYKFAEIAKCMRKIGVLPVDPITMPTTLPPLDCLLDISAELAAV
jgi:hypothetical protein